MLKIIMHFGSHEVIPRNRRQIVENLAGKCL